MFGNPTNTSSTLMEFNTAVQFCKIIRIALGGFGEMAEVVYIYYLVFGTFTFTYKVLHLFLTKFLQRARGFFGLRRLGRN